ncbi:MAG: HPF/RaiA family ribosome-associated protein [Planctomycetota bacterium]
MSRLNVTFDTGAVDLRDSNREYFARRLDKLSELTERFPERECHIHLERSTREGTHEVRISLRLPGTTLTGRAEESHLRGAFDRAFKKLVRQLREFKQLLRREHLHRHMHGEAENAAARQVGFPYAAPGHEVEVFRREAEAEREALERFLASEARQLARRAGIRVEVAAVASAALEEAARRFDEKPRRVSSRGWIYEVALHALEAAAAERGAAGPGMHGGDHDDEVEELVAYFVGDEEAGAVSPGREDPAALRRRLSGALSELPRDWRRCFRLHYVEGFDLVTIERMLELSEDQVRFRLRGAAEFLRDHVEEGRDQAV